MRAHMNVSPRGKDTTNLIIAIRHNQFGLPKKTRSDLCDERIRAIIFLTQVRYET
jgi:hypothetical protein